MIFHVETVPFHWDETMPGPPMPPWKDPAFASMQQCRGYPEIDEDPP
jgi:hypothetical protein